jgi:hypothetical protein
VDFSRFEIDNGRGIHPFPVRISASKLGIGVREARRRAFAKHIVLVARFSAKVIMAPPGETAVENRH